MDEELFGRCFTISAISLLLKKKESAKEDHFFPQESDLFISTLTGNLYVYFPPSQEISRGFPRKKTIQPTSFPKTKSSSGNRGSTCAKSNATNDGSKYEKLRIKMARSRCVKCNTDKEKTKSTQATPNNSKKEAIHAGDFRNDKKSK